MTDSLSRPAPTDPFGSSVDEIDGEVEIPTVAVEAPDELEAAVEAPAASEAPAKAPHADGSHVPSPDGLPQRTTAAPHPVDLEALDLARRVVELAEDKKAAEIVLLDVTGMTTIADYFVICTGGSDRQVGAIADSIVDGLHKERVIAIGREGEPESHWILLDYGVVLVHIFAPPEREYYQLEKLWAEAKTVLRVQ